MRKTGEIKRNGGIGCRNVVCAHRKNEREEARPKTVERNRTRLMDKIRILLEQVDEAIAQENSIKDTSVEFTPCLRFRNRQKFSP